MKIRELFEAQSHEDIMNLIHKDISKIHKSIKYFDAISKVQGFELAANKCKIVILEIRTAEWYYQFNLTTLKLKLAYQKLQQAISYLEEKINSGL